MSTFNTLKKKLGPFAIPNLTVYIVLGQTFFYFVSRVNPPIVTGMLLIPELVIQGQVWRLITFVLVPPDVHPIFAFFALYLFYLMGTALEGYWGTISYNLYLLIGYVATIAVSFAFPASYPTNLFAATSVFLAFAWLNPEFVLYIFFVLPVAIKWLALITWIAYGLGFAFGDWQQRALIAASVLNFLVFFGRDVYRKARGGARRMQTRATRVAEQAAPMHRCTVCGATERSHPKTDFRYCTKCTGGPCYCEEHIRDHEHV